MMRTACLLACVVGLATAAWAETVTLTVTNPVDQARPGAVCIGPASLLGASVPVGACTGASRDGQKIAVQVDDLNGDGIADEFAMVVDLAAGATTSVWVDPAKPWDGPDRADVRLSWRYEGYAALETDVMAAGLYGIYAPAGFAASLQWDLYGKRPDARGLSLDALEGVNYHEDNPVAVDYLLVGNSMGLGGPMIGDGRPLLHKNGEYTYRELCNGPVRAGLEVRVTGWGTPAGGLYDAKIDYVVYAGHDFIDSTFALTQRKPCDGPFGLGARRIPHPDLFLADDEEGVLAVMGQQEGIIGKTGLAILFEPDRFLRWGVAPGDPDAYMVYFSPLQEAGTDLYRARLVGVWSEAGIATEDTMADHARDLALRFREPVVVTR